MGYCPMVVVHRAFGFRFVIYTLDHEPAHLHIIGEGHAKINLSGLNDLPEIVFSVGIKRPEMRRVFEEVVTHRAEFLRDWRRIHGRPD